MCRSQTAPKGLLADRVAVVTGSNEGDPGFCGKTQDCIAVSPFVDFQGWVEEEWWEGVRLTCDLHLHLQHWLCCLPVPGPGRAHVVISSWEQQNVDCVVAMLKGEGLSVMGTVCHVGKAEDREQLVAKILDMNVKALALLLSQLLPHMENRGAGAVTLVSSVAAYMPLAELGAYNISKTALLGLTRTLALELAPKDVRVNCLVPGLIKTVSSKTLHKNKAFWNLLKENHQLKRQVVFRALVVQDGAA
ncbi:Dehydrogenase/reductase SDR family member 2 [Heterocephalus glaber]|uniref:Dehydrogenase/reductase SDR family member 2 n=1 Tax=Heterocephalus glaber TaxID=10181 RepID=G5ASM5_HETGA|nr:Dehydrogenase/reductase SDR family member 2 [Heterocephalus glaber]